MAETPTGRRLWGRISTLSIALIMGMALLWMGVPQLVAALWMLPGDSTLQRLQKQKPVTAKKLEIVIESRTAALKWISSGQIYNDRALGRLMQEDATGPDAQQIRADRLNRAIQDLEAGLALAPADPYGWARLALVKQLRTGPSKDVASALIMSLLTGPYEPDMIPLRLELAFQNWGHLAVRDRELVDQQIRYAWIRSKKQILEMARDPRRLAAIRAALAKEPGSLEGFEKLYSRPSR